MLPNTALIGWYLTADHDAVERYIPFHREPFVPFIEHRTVRARPTRQVLHALFAVE